MSGDEAARTQLRELLLDDVPLPPDTVREAMFDHTFAAEPGTGVELLPPDGLFDPAPGGTVSGGTDPGDPDSGDPDPGDDGAWRDDGAWPDHRDPPDGWSDHGHPDPADHAATDHAATDHDAPGDVGGHPGGEGVVEPGDPSSLW